jgi:D-alanine-D-alanine ligase-like ATP-grasp enzyme
VETPSGGNMKVCVLQADYSGTNLEYGRHDPARDLSPLLQESKVDHIFLRKASVYKQLREAARHDYDIFVNLCEGYLDWDIPSIDVIWSLDSLGLPYTGPPMRLYDPSKPLMKYVAHTQGVRFPAFVEISKAEDTATAARSLNFPVFVKPAHAGDSRGIDEHSLVTTQTDLERQCAALLPEFGTVLVEQYIAGREFTVLVAGGVNGGLPLALQPVEFLFPAEVPFKTYALKVQEHHPSRNVTLRDNALEQCLRAAAMNIFAGFSGEGYARLDFRVNEAGHIFFLDINFACSIFYPPGYEGSADYVLANDPLGADGFLRHVIAEGQSRYQRRRKRYQRRGDAVSGFGIYATLAIAAGDVVYPGEERPHRIVTRSHVENTWQTGDQIVFRSYAYPLSEEVYVIWDDDPDQWAPQNHACDPNTGYRGLDVVALRDIAPGEELTLDYSSFCNDTMTPFDCCCRSANCRGRIEGRSGTSVTASACRVSL